MPKTRTIDETPVNHHSFLECLQLEFETLPQMMFLEGTKATTLPMRFIPAHDQHSFLAVRLR
jgi:hypothetical protein